MATASSRTARALYLGLGFLMLGIAIVGIFLPGIPTTGPVLLAAFSFSKSSEKFDRWMLSHRRFGPIVRSWRLRGGFTMRVKRLAALFIALTFTITVRYTGLPLWADISLLSFATVLTGWIVTRPTISEGDKESLMLLSYEEIMA